MRRPERKVRAAVALVVTGMLILSGCGGSGDTETNGQQNANGGSAGGGGTNGTAGGGASSPLEAAFPKPKPQPGSPPAAQKAIDAGRSACRGKTPQQVSDEFMAEAEDNLNDGQKEMLADLAHFEKRVSADFVAGQLAAGVYEATLPEELRIAGYQGCVYELAQQLQKELAQK